MGEVDELFDVRNGEDVRMDGSTGTASLLALAFLSVWRQLPPNIHAAAFSLSLSLSLPFIDSSSHWCVSAVHQ
jgi:hypothetical protein